MFMLKISVIIGSYNQKSVLQKVVDSFSRQSALPDEFEVIVVDSSSTDGTQEFLHSFKPQFLFRPMVIENNGKAHARNTGIKAAAAPIILITDADMIADPELIKTHILAHESAIKPSCFEGLTYNLTRLEWPTTSANISPYITRNYKQNTKLGWFYFLTGNLSIPKQLFLDNNGFDTEFTGYGWEDLELGYRLSLKKIPLFYLKNAINYHYHVVDQSGVIERNFHKGRSAQVFLKKHPEQRLFLGINPLAASIYKTLKKWPYLHQKIEIYYKKTNHSFWHYLLSEYQYLDGLLT